MHSISQLKSAQVRGLESGVVPLTSMAAHAVDEEVDIELDVNNKVNETRENTKEASFGSLPFPPPPPPIREINHSRVSKFSEFHDFHFFRLIHIQLELFYFVSSISLNLER